MGIRNPIVGLTTPTGYLFNPGRFLIYSTLAMVLITHVTSTPLATTDPVTILLVSLMTPKDAYGIPGSTPVILTTTLTAILTIPVADLVLVLSVDRFMDTGHALTSPIGNCAATVTIARWENNIDVSRVQAIPDRYLGTPAKASDEPLKRSTMTGEGKLHG